MNRTTANLLIAVGLIAMVISLRVLPHAANFAPVAAAAIFGGAVLPRKLAVWVPLVAMIISDSIIGFHDLVLLTWACYVLFALAASHWLRSFSILRGGAIALSSSVVFFGATNLGVWATSGMYTHTWEGLSRCFYMAMPFFRNTLASDLIYTTALFGIYALASRASQKVLPPNYSTSRTV